MTTMSPEKADLYQRLVDVMGTRDVHPDDRDTMREAFDRAASWADLPADVQRMIEEYEQDPAQSWDDPADVPDEILNAAADNALVQAEGRRGPYVTLEDATRGLREEPEAARSEDDADLDAVRAAGGDEFRRYWTEDPEGLAKWATKPHPWTALRNHLVEHVGPERAERIASQWFKKVFGIWPGEREGDNPVGPG